MRLIDIRASHSVEAWSWVKKLRLKKTVKYKNLSMKDAQEGTIPIRGIITLPVTFGNKVFFWKFRVADTLVCPMIIGVNILNKATIELKDGIIKIEDQERPLSLTSKEIHRHVVVATETKRMLPNTVANIKAKIMINKNYNDNNDSRVCYIVNTEGTLLTDQLVGIDKINTKSIINDKVIINMLIANGQNKQDTIKEGKILGFAENISKEELEGVCNIEEMFKQSRTLTSSLSVGNESGHKEPDINQPTPQKDNNGSTYKSQNFEQTPGHQGYGVEAPPNYLSTQWEVGQIHPNIVRRISLNQCHPLVEKEDGRGSKSTKTITIGDGSYQCFTRKSLLFLYFILCTNTS